METTNTESTNKPFSRREWLFAGALVMLIEYWIFSVSHSVSGEQAIVNYVSFASTIASILLAVIAIIYSFVQTDSQQKTGNAIASQIERLKDASQQIGDSKNQLQMQLDRLSTVTEKIDDLQDLVGSKMDYFQVELGQIRNNLNTNYKTIPSVSLPANIDSIEIDIVLKAILHSTFNADLFAHSLLQFRKQPNLVTNWIDFADNHFAKPLHTNKENINEYIQYLSVGIQILSTLKSLGLLTGDFTKLALSDKLITYLDAYQTNLATATSKIIENIPRIESSFKQV